MLNYDPLWGYNYKVGYLESSNYVRLPYTLSTTNITENINAISHICYWKGTIGHTGVTAVAVAEDIKIIDSFPAKYKILEIFIDNTEVWDDGAGPMTACTISAGWTGAGYADLIATQDILGAVTQIGDAAGELAYVAVQGGIRPSWGATTDIYLRFVADQNLSTLTTGELTVYITYQIYE
jgi:hypothetical protein